LDGFPSTPSIAEAIPPRLFDRDKRGSVELLVLFLGDGEVPAVAEHRVLPE
jgi:hypothetical protein